jgi:hypothetical protein
MWVNRVIFFSPFFNRVPEVIFWHIPSKAYKNVAPRLRIHKPCVGSMNKEKVAAQEAELGIMDMLVKRSSVKVRSCSRNNVQCLKLTHTSKPLWKFENLG